MTRRGSTSADFARTLDATHYYVRAKWSAGASLAETGKHQYLLTGYGQSHRADGLVFAPANRIRAG